MNKREARELAAQIWCEKIHENKVMDVDFAESIANLLVRETSNKDMYERALVRLKANPALLSVMPTAMVVGTLKRPDERFAVVAEHILKTIFEVSDDPKPKASQQ